MPQNQHEILGGKAIIFTNDFDIWQFRSWIREEKKHVRKSLKTKDKHQAIALAEDVQMWPCLSDLRSNQDQSANTHKNLKTQ